MAKQKDNRRQRLLPDARELTPLERHALKVLGKKADACRDELASGDGQGVDVTVRVSGALGVGIAQTVPKPEKPSAVALAGVLLAHFGPRVRQRVIDAAAATYAKEAEAALEEQVTDDAERLVELCTRRGQQHQRGPVTGLLAVEVVARGGEPV